MLLPRETPEEQKARAERVIALLRAMRQGDDENLEEQRATFAALKRGLDEGRPPELQRFPES